MKVNNKIGQNIGGIESSKAGRTEGGKKSGEAKSTAFSGGDIGSNSRVDVSARAQAMQKAKAIASQDTIDEAKVAHFQKLIDDGKYKVDSKAVANRLVDEQLRAEGLGDLVDE